MRLAPVATGMLVAALVAGCSGGGDGRETAAGNASVAGGSVTGTSGSGSVPTSSASGSAPPSSTSAPPVTSGPLSQSNVPQPTVLGGGWQTNGKPDDTSHAAPQTPSWLRARDPADVNAALPPLGCSGLTQAPAYPIPKHALQGRYLQDGSNVNAVVLVLDYADEAAARSFLQAYGRDIRVCPAPATQTPQSPYVRAVTVLEATDSIVRDRWVEYGAGAGPNGWHEVIVREGARVGLADVEAPAGTTPDLTPLTSTLRAVVGR